MVTQAEKTWSAKTNELRTKKEQSELHKTEIHLCDVIYERPRRDLFKGRLHNRDFLVNSSDSHTHQLI